MYLENIYDVPGTMIWPDMYHSLWLQQLRKENVFRGFPGDTVVKNLPANTGDTGDEVSVPGSERSPGEGNCNLLQYSCLEYPMNRGAWRVPLWNLEKGIVCRKRQPMPGHMAGRAEHSQVLRTHWSLLSSDTFV